MNEKILLFPEAATGRTPTEKSDLPHSKGKYPCPCCGYLTLPVERSAAIAFICPVCCWENDVFTAGDEEPSDENGGLTLSEGRKNFRSFGACSKGRLPYARKPRPEELTD